MAAEGPALIAGCRVMIGRATNRKDEKGKEFTVFHITVMRVDGKSWTTTRRFSQFDLIHKRLKQAFPHAKLPVLPPKRWIGSLDTHFVDRRRIELQRYLQTLLDTRVLRKSVELRCFMGPDDFPSLALCSPRKQAPLTPLLQGMAASTSSDAAFRAQLLDVLAALGSRVASAEHRCRKAERAARRALRFAKLAAGQLTADGRRRLQRVARDEAKRHEAKRDARPASEKPRSWVGKLALLSDSCSSDTENGTEQPAFSLPHERRRAAARRHLSGGGMRQRPKASRSSGFLARFFRMHKPSSRRDGNTIPGLYPNESPPAGEDVRSSQRWGVIGDGGSPGVQKASRSVTRIWGRSQQHQTKMGRPRAFSDGFDAKSIADTGFFGHSEPWRPFVSALTAQKQEPATSSNRVSLPTTPQPPPQDASLFSTKHMKSRRGVAHEAAPDSVPDISVRADAASLSETKNGPTTARSHRSVSGPAASESVVVPSPHGSDAKRAELTEIPLDGLPLNALPLEGLPLEGSPLKPEADVWSDPSVTAEIDAVLKLLVASPQLMIRRRQALSFITELLHKSIGGQVFPHGSYALRTDLPDSDIDVSAFFAKSHSTTWVQRIVHSLCQAAGASGVARHLRVRSVMFVNAEVPVIKVMVGRIPVDISGNQIGALEALGLFEAMDRVVGQDHLLKRTTLLFKAWARHEAKILSSKDGMISSYCLRTIVLFVFNSRYQRIKTPLGGLFEIFTYLKRFDWDTLGLGLFGPVLLCELPNFVPARDHKLAWPQGVSPLIEQNMLRRYSALHRQVHHWRISPNESQKCTLVPNFLTVIDPTNPFNNLARSVQSYKNARFIQNTFASAARGLHEMVRNWATKQSLEKPQAHWVSRELFVSTIRRYCQYNGWPRHTRAPKADSIIGSAARSAQSESDQWTETDLSTAETGVTGSIDSPYVADLSLFDTQLARARQFEAPDLLESELVALVTVLLGMHGTVPIGRMGSMLHTATNNHSLPSMLKAKYGGLKRFLSKHKDKFKIGTQHPYNPPVTACAEPTVQQQKLVEQIVAASGGSLKPPPTGKATRGSRVGSRRGPRRGGTNADKVPKIQTKPRLTKLPPPLLGLMMSHPHSNGGKVTRSMKTSPDKKIVTKGTVTKGTVTPGIVTPGTPTIQTTTTFVGSPLQLSSAIKGPTHDKKKELGLVPPLVIDRARKGWASIGASRAHDEPSRLEDALETQNGARNAKINRRKVLNDEEFPPLMS